MSLQNINGWVISNVDGKFYILFDRKRLIDFDLIEDVQKFIDLCNKEFKERTPWLTLHLGGCKRCQRTVDGVRSDPCERGKTMLLNAKLMMEHLSGIAAAAIKEVREREQAAENAV